MGAKLTALMAYLGLLIGLNMAAAILFEVDGPELAPFSFETYENKFYEEAVIYGKQIQKKHIIYMFADHQDNIIGVCYPYTAIPMITIDRKYWWAANERQRTALIFHELGHCVLGRAHVDSVERDGCATSLMNSIAEFAGCFPEQYGRYLLELFGSNKPAIR